MVTLAKKRPTVGVSSGGMGATMRMTVASASAARKHGIRRAARATAKAHTVALRSIVIRITKPLMMKNSSTPKWPSKKFTDSGARPG
jgi:hypothetical protein